MRRIGCVVVAIAAAVALAEGDRCYDASLTPWETYHAAVRLQAARNMLENMTGPGGRLYIQVQPIGGGGFRRMIRPDVLWLGGETIDFDGDWDVDLYDWHLARLEDSKR